MDTDKLSSALDSLDVPEVAPGPHMQQFASQLQELLVIQVLGSHSRIQSI